MRGTLCRWYCTLYPCVYVAVKCTPTARPATHGVPLHHRTSSRISALPVRRGCLGGMQCYTRLPCRPCRAWSACCPRRACSACYPRRSYAPSTRRVAPSPPPPPGLSSRMRRLPYIGALVAPTRNAPTLPSTSAPYINFDAAPTTELAGRRPSPVSRAPSDRRLARALLVPPDRRRGRLCLPRDQSRRRPHTRECAARPPPHVKGVPLEGLAPPRAPPSAEHQVHEVLCRHDRVVVQLRAAALPVGIPSRGRQTRLAPRRAYAGAGRCDEELECRLNGRRPRRRPRVAIDGRPPAAVARGGAGGGDLQEGGHPVIGVQTQCRRRHMSWRTWGGGRRAEQAGVGQAECPHRRQAAGGRSGRRLEVRELVRGHVVGGA
ncbi:hypothetical protein BU14_1356s0003 [Porphyra umbilicalis]|uniref:Uncharacterized protein n=1 Tax=Porphyra umbilicalis TaxID=2786 RepID=A0A1X6NLZ6_PORUM|nr:hypothetical protein BU14_1356s0003 [Porphyra umbilicalis]|eukprot:OSX69607.1 hypothetical protein BU14_1356s0003 [Porphyra umbilicalis]